MKTCKATPVFLSFFTIGFVDIVGSAANYIKADFHLNDKQVGVLPVMVFIWFAILSVPAGIMMNKEGRRKTALLGLAVTIVSLLTPFFHYTLSTLVLAFAGIGIGNTLLQVSVNALLSDVVSTKRLSISLTGGQLVKAISSWLGPIILMAAAITKKWQFAFPFLAIVTLVNLLWLLRTDIEDQEAAVKDASFARCFGLLKDPVLLKLLLGVTCIVGIDIGLNIILPKYIMEKIHWSLPKAGLISSLYFLSRMIGSLIGVVWLNRSREQLFFAGSVIMGGIATFLLVLTANTNSIIVLIICAGLAVSNIFPLLFAQALRHKQEFKNEVSGLLIMGVSGGALFLPLAGMVANNRGLPGFLVILLVLWSCLIIVIPGSRKICNN